MSTCHSDSAQQGRPWPPGRCFRPGRAGGLRLELLVQARLRHRRFVLTIQMYVMSTGTTVTKNSSWLSMSKLRENILWRSNRLHDCGLKHPSMLLRPSHGPLITYLFQVVLCPRTRDSYTAPTYFQHQQHVTCWRGVSWLRLS